MRTIKYRLWTAGRMDYEPLTQMGEKVNDMFSDGNTWLAFTGLKDKTGKEIYEGDIVKQRFTVYKDNPRDRQILEFTGSVEWDTEEKTASFWLVGDDPRGVLKTMYRSILEEPTEIIGNIYENPELLNG